MKFKTGRRMKITLAIFAVLFMFSGVYGLLQDYHPPASGVNSPNPISPYTASQSYTGSTSTEVSYYTGVSVANSGTTDVSVPIDENSTFSTGSFGSGNSWTLTSNSENAYWKQTLTGEPNYIYLSSTADTIEFDSIAFELGTHDTSQQLGTVWANLTIDGFTGTWSHTFDFLANSNSYYAIITPTYNFFTFTPYYLMSDFSSGTLLLNVSGYGYAYSTSPYDLFTTTEYQGQNVIESNINTTPDSVPLVEGYHYGIGSSTLSLPGNETAFDISWSSPVNFCAKYEDSKDTGTSGSFTGNATHGASEGLSFCTTASIPDPSAGENDEGYFVYAAYYFDSQTQAKSQSTTETSSPSYTYTPVSGTTNELSSSYSFSGTTPSGAIFSDYGGSLTVTFTPTLSVDNPYYNYKQNELVASLSGASTGSSSTSGTQSVSFTGASASYTSSTSPSWTVSLDLYGNVLPSVDSYNAKWTGTNDRVELWFNATQTIFSNETLQLVVNWGNGNTSTFTSSNTYGNNYGFVEYYTYSQVGSYTITATLSNDPNPSNNYLTSLSNSTAMSESYTISISPTVKQSSTGNTLPSGSVLQKDESLNVYFSSTNDIVSKLSIYENDGSGYVLVANETFDATSGEISDVEPSYEGVYSFVLKLVFDGANATFTYNYEAPYYPVNLSDYVTVYYSNSVTELTSSNYTTLQVHYWYYNHANSYGSNLTEWLYQYDIPDNQSHFMRINFNNTWLFYSASVPVYGTISDSNGSVILNSTNWNTVQLDLLEPITIANPLGELTISYSPSTALAQVAGVKIPFSELTTYVNGKEMVADNYQYVVGDTLSIKTVDIFNQTIASYNITPTSQIEDLQIMVPFSQMQFANLNSTYYVSIFVEQNEIPQALTSVMPLQTVTIYIPDGTYNFSFQFHAISNDVIMPSNYYRVMSVDGLGVYFFKGILFYGIDQNLNTTKANLSSLLTNISIVIDANNSIVGNLLTKINIDLNANNSNISKLLYDISDNTTIINSNITHLLLQMETNFTFVHDLINDMNISFTDRMTFLNDTIKTLNLNETTYFNITHDIVSSINLTESQRYQMEADAGTFAYHFVPKNETTNNTGIFITSWLENAADKPVDNKTLVYEVWKNLSISYVNLTDNYLVPPHLISYNSYSIVIFLPLNKTQLYSLQNDSGKTELSMYSPFVLNSVSNIATGNINPSNAVFVNSTAVVPWYVGMIANYYPPYSSNPIKEIENVIIWILDNAGGRALTLLVGLATLAYFAWMINRSRKNKGDKKWKYRIEKKMDRLYRKIVGESSSGGS